MNDLNETLTVSHLNRPEEVPGASQGAFSLSKLEDDLRLLHQKWQAVEAELSERDEKIASLRQDVAVYKKRCSELKSDDRVKKLEAQNVELSVHKQELQDYIDGRKAAWEDINKRVRDYENTIKGMSDTVSAHENVVAGKEEEKAALALKVMELERELAALRGRFEEKEARNEVLQQNLDDQSRELGTLNADAIRLHKDVEKLNTDLQCGDETVNSLREQLQELERDKSELEGLVSDNKSTIAKLELELNVANERIEELAGNQQSQDQTDQFEIRAAELAAELLELQANYKTVSEELEAQRELVVVLEDEMSKKPEVDEQNAERISALGSGIKDLDLQINDLWLRHPSENSVLDQEVFENSEEVMILPEDLFDVGEQTSEHQFVVNDEISGEEVCYPLSGKAMTIGRSPHNDIRLKSKFISRVHAKILIEGASAIIEDAGSMNGFLVNSVPTHRHELQDGDELEIGDRKLRYLHS